MPSAAEARTLFAPATAPGRAAVAIVRLSGPAAFDALARLTRAPHPQPRRATRARIMDPEDGELVDDVLVLGFPAPHSFTGEDVVELHLHGGAGVLRRVLDLLAAMPELHAAEAGAFSRRAFHNGRLDLLQAEAIADLVDAESEAQIRLAARQLDGALGRLYRGWSERLVRLLALVEAEIDFGAEETDVGEAGGTLGPELADLRAAILAHLADQRGERLRDGVRVAVLGAPNAGKSSLVNALAGRDVAIVSDIPGTTRDVIEVHLELDGVPVTLLDMAGLRATTEPVETLGVERALERAKDADLRLLLVDGAAPPETTAGLPEGWREAEILCLSKADLGAPLPGWLEALDGIPLSVRTPGGLEPLLARLREAARRLALPGAAPVFTRLRHRQGLGETAEALERAREAPEVALIAEDLRLALRSLGTLTGAVSVEAVLDQIFARFCIGK